MGQLTIRDMDDAAIERLKRRAAGNHRSLEGEVREILVLASRQVDMATARAMAEESLRATRGRITGDSADLIREDRDR